MELKYVELRALMIQKDCEFHDLAQHLHMKTPALHAKFEDRSMWKLEEVYSICEYLHIPLDQISYYFPRRGGEQK